MGCCTDTTRPPGRMGSRPARKGVLVPEGGLRKSTPCPRVPPRHECPWRGPMGQGRTLVLLAVLLVMNGSACLLASRVLRRVRACPRAGSLPLDEPCSSPHPPASRRVECLIQHPAGRPTVVLLTHNLAQARRLSGLKVFVWLGAGGGPPSGRARRSCPARDSAPRRGSTTRCHQATRHEVQTMKAGGCARADVPRLSNGRRPSTAEVTRPRGAPPQAGARAASMKAWARGSTVSSSRAARWSLSARVEAPRCLMFATSCRKAARRSLSSGSRGSSSSAS